MHSTPLLLAAALLCSACSPTTFQLALYNPAQIVSEETDVRGLRLSLIYGKNASVEGLDVGVVNHAREARGVAVGILHIVDEDFSGLQVSPIGASVTHGSLRGVQAAFGLSSANDLAGVQLSIVNTLAAPSSGIQAATFANLHKSDLTGMQIALLNHAADLGGIQIGGINLSETTNGAQIGAIWNYASGSASGLQLGLINSADELDGVQIGLLNFCSNGFLPFFPIINFAF